MGRFHLGGEEIVTGVPVKDGGASGGFRELFAACHLPIGVLYVLLHAVQGLGRVFQRLHDFPGVAGQIGKPQGFGGKRMELVVHGRRRQPAGQPVILVHGGAVGVDVAVKDIGIVGLDALLVVVQIRLRQLFGHGGVAVRAGAVQIVFQLGNLRHGIPQFGFCVVDHIGGRLEAVSLRRKRLLRPLLFREHFRRVFPGAQSGLRLLGPVGFFGLGGVQQLQGLLAPFHRVVVFPAAIIGVDLLNDLLQPGVRPHPALQGILRLK